MKLMTIIGIIGLIIVMLVVLFMFPTIKFFLGQITGWNANSDFVVFPGAIAERQGVKAGKDAVFYNPTKSEIKSAEEFFKNKVPNFDSYYKQYYAVKSISSKSRIVYLQGVLKDSESSVPNWRSEIMFVFDGGSTYVNGMVNLETGTVLYEFNGES